MITREEQETRDSFDALVAMLIGPALGDVVSQRRSAVNLAMASLRAIGRDDLAAQIVGASSDD